MQAIVKNPRLTVSAEIELESGVFTCTFPKDANELEILTTIRGRVAEESATRVNAGAPPLPVPTDEELAPALAALRRLEGVARDV